MDRDTHSLVERFKFYNRFAGGPETWPRLLLQKIARWRCRRDWYHLPLEKLVVTVDEHGNTSAASIPLALDAAVRKGQVKKGDTVMLEGVGGGFTWGAVLLDF